MRAQLDDASFETDFADLAARFSAKSGGGLSPELSADLALEIVLNEIVEQACLATGATGAAIVLQRDGEMVCRASTGATAPELGSRLDVESGLSGECIRTLRTQRCDDTDTDPRVDSAASKRLGVRSLVVMPLLRDGELVGVFELFSSQPLAFGERDELTLEALGSRTLNNLKRAAEPLEAQVTEQVGSELPDAVSAEAVPHDTPQMEAAASEVIPGRSFDFVTAALSLAVLLCAILLGVVLGRHFWFSHSGIRARQATANPAAPLASSSKESNVDMASTTTPNSKAARSALPPGGLLVSQNGKEVFRMAPDGSQSDQTPGTVQRASSVQPVGTKSRSTQTSLLKRVEPDYPQDALRQKIQGAVVLRVQIRTDGTVQDVQALSGPQLLSAASIDAVKQWKFRAPRVGGRPAESETTVTLNFRLPQ